MICPWCLIPLEQPKLSQLFCPARQTLIFAFPNSYLYLWKREWTFRKKKWAFIFWPFWEILVNMVPDDWSRTQNVCHFGNTIELQLGEMQVNICFFHGTFPLGVNKFMWNFCHTIYNFYSTECETTQSSVGSYWKEDLRSPSLLQLPTVVKLNKWGPMVVSIPPTGKWMLAATFNTNIGHKYLRSSKLLLYYTRGNRGQLQNCK